MRIVDVACLAAAIAGAAYVYGVKHNAELAHDERRMLERDIGNLAQDVRLLEADLAALQQPARLQAIVGALGESFALGPITSAHYTAISDIPFRHELANPGSEASDQLLESHEQDLSVVPVIEAPGALDLLVQQLTGSTLDTTPPADPIADDIGTLLEVIAPEERP